MWINNETSFRVNFKKINNEDNNKNNNENKNEVNKIKINFSDFLNFSALCRLIKNFDSKLKLKLKLTL